jgi:hypothetical protein
LPAPTPNIAQLASTLPLAWAAVYKREQLLRRRFLRQSTAHPPLPPEAPALSPVGLMLAGNQLVIFGLLLSALCWAVHRLASGGMAALLGTWDEMCPGATHS